jgi:serine phosphatase RsbU (regulator of sigma subunit)
VADCTGHGVPGAFMTLLASASLSQALEQIGPRNPSALLAAVNRNVKALLGQINGVGDAPQSNDGLDAAFFWFDAGRQSLEFAGARVALHVLRPESEQFESIAGDRMGVGYVDSLADYAWEQHAVDVPPGSLLFMSTDGLTDQIGGPRKIGFGKRRALDLILGQRENTCAAISASLVDSLAQWQGSQVRRDDVTFFFARV